MEVADSHEAKNIAFPSISTGIHGYDIELAAKIAVTTVSAYLSKGSGIREITFSSHSLEDLAVYWRLLANWQT